MPDPPRGCFVTGTGTDVGKSVCAALIARTLATRGERVAVFKPAVSGLDDGGEPDHELLRRAAGSSQSDDEIAPYRYGPPVSPHLAAALAGNEIRPPLLRAGVRDAAAGADALVCEGVGGLLVPLTLGYLVRDFAREVGLPLVVASSPGLGTINHTLLTLEAARAADLEVALVVLTPWPGAPSVREASNLDTLRRLAGAEVVTLEHVDLTAPSTWPQLAPPAL